MAKSSTSLENIPLVEAHHYGGKQRPKLIILRTSWTSGDRGAANGIAQAWHSPLSPIDSCHYVVDEAQTIRCVPDKIQAIYCSRSHKGAITINVCHDPPLPPTDEVLTRVAKLTARLCKHYRIPVRILDESDERRWLNHPWKSRGGILLKTTAGILPVRKYLRFVELEYKSQTGR